MSGHANKKHQVFGGIFPHLIPPQKAAQIDHWPRTTISQFDYTHDPHTTLTHYQLRPYNPTLGRFITRDPIEEEGGLNLYGLVGNNPVGRFDLLGLDDGCCNEKEMAMRQIGVKGVAITALFACLMLAGCRDKSQGLQEVESLSRDAVVVMKCECEARRNTYNVLELHFRVAEVWRDESNGMFTNKVEGWIDFTLGLADNDSFSPEAVLFFETDNSGLCPPGISFIYDGKLHGVPVRKAMHIISTTSASGGPTNVLRQKP